MFCCFPLLACWFAAHKPTPASRQIYREVRTSGMLTSELGRGARAGSFSPSHSKSSTESGADAGKILTQVSARWEAEGDPK